MGVYLLGLGYYISLLGGGGLYSPFIFGAGSTEPRAVPENKTTAFAHGVTLLRPHTAAVWEVAIPRTRTLTVSRSVRVTSIPILILGRHLVGFVQDSSSYRCKTAVFGFIEKTTLKLEALQTSKAHIPPQNGKTVKW